MRKMMVARAAVLGGMAALLLAAAAGPERWEGAIKRFEGIDRETPPPAAPVLFVGSSSIVFWDVEKSFPGLTVLNRGFGGSTMAELLHFFDRVVTPYKPRALVVYSGDNDIAGGASVETVAADYAEFLRRVRAQWAECPVVFIGIKPSALRWKHWDAMRDVNDRVRRLCEADAHAHFVDPAPLMLGADGLPDPALYQLDRLHVNEAAYAKWAAVVAPLIAE
jgi:lysophospholipase L1-like esterase